MPRKKRSPKTPESPAPDWFDYPEARVRIFSGNFVAWLARKFKIDEALIPELQKALESWADVFRVHKAFSDDRPRPGAIKAQLELINSRIDDLRSTLEHLHPETEQRFWEPETTIGQRLLSKEGISTSPYGHTIFQIATSPKEWTIFYINRIRHFESLEILRNYAEAAIKHIGEDSGGRIRSEALKMWAVNVINYWENTLKRKFTLKFGASFCIEAFKAIDPTLPQARLVTAMRNAMKAPSQSDSARTRPK